MRGGGRGFDSLCPRSHSFCVKNVVTCDFDGDRHEIGGPRPPPNKNIFLLFLKSVSCFLEMIFTGGPQLSACKNDDFYWSLVLAVTKTPL